MPGTGTCEELSYNSSRFNSARHSEASNIEYNVNRLAKIVGLGQRIRNKRNSSHFMTYRQQKSIYESQVEKANRDKILQNEIIATLQENDEWQKNNQVTSLNNQINMLSQKSITMDPSMRNLNSSTLLPQIQSSKMIQMQAPQKVLATPQKLESDSRFEKAQSRYKQHSRTSSKAVEENKNCIKKQLYLDMIEHDREQIQSLLDRKIHHSKLKKTLDTVVGNGKITMQSFINVQKPAKTIEKQQKESLYAMTAIDDLQELALDIPMKKSELVQLAQQPVLEVTKEVLEEELTGSKEYELLSDNSSIENNKKFVIANSSQASDRISPHIKIQLNTDSNFNTSKKSQISNKIAIESPAKQNHIDATKALNQQLQNSENQVQNPIKSVETEENTFERISEESVSKIKKKLSQDGFDKFIQQNKDKQRQIDQEYVDLKRPFQTNFTTIDPKLQLLKGTISHESASRVQRMFKSTKLKQQVEQRVNIYQGWEKDEETEDDDENSMTSSQIYEMEKLAEFNSERDLYSEQEISQYPMLRRLSTMRRKHQQVIQEQQEKSSQETESLRASPDLLDPDDALEQGSGENSEKKSEEEEEPPESPSQVKGKTLEKNKYINDFMRKRADEEDRKQLCGSRLQGKIDKMLAEFHEKSGLDEHGKKQNQEEFQRNLIRTGNTSLFKLELAKNNNEKGYVPYVQAYGEEIKASMAFYLKAKNALESKYQTEEGEADSKLKFYKECYANQAVARPLFTKILDHKLLLRDIIINTGIAKGLQASLLMDNSLIEKLFLDNNCLKGDDLAHILNGLTNQKPLKSLTIAGRSNRFNKECAIQVVELLQRKVPDNLIELHLIEAKCRESATELLLRSIKEKTFLRKLSLVRSGINDKSFKSLVELIRSSKMLISLDISWNKLVPDQFQELLPVIYKNKKLQSLNLSWNNILDANPTEKRIDHVLLFLGKIIKQNKNMHHMDLSGTGLNDKVVYELGQFLRRARAVCSIHLSGNPGAEKNREYLNQRIHCMANEDMLRFGRIQTLLKELNREKPQNILDGIKIKKQRDIDFRVRRQQFDPMLTDQNAKLIFQRILGPGFKKMMPGIAQWYETSLKTTQLRDHHKHDCWVCEGHVKTIIFWSRGKAFKLDPIFNKDKTEIIRFQIDKDYSEQGKAFTNASVGYSKLENQIPYVAGTFNGWRYQKMFDLEEFNRSHDDDSPDPFEVAKEKGLIKSKLRRLQDGNDYDQRHVEITAIKQRLKYVYKWQRYFPKTFPYKNMFILNGHEFTQKPSDDGTLPDQDLVDDGQALELLSETSEEIEEIKEVEPEVVDPYAGYDTKNMNRDELEELKKRIEAEIKYRKENPLPELPDVTKFDKVFILPLFCKPGKHTYMVKYKDESERKQQHNIKRRDKQVKRHNQTKQGLKPDKPFDKEKYKQLKNKLNPECFIYQCEVPPRSEEIIPFSKTMGTKVQVREFDYESSIWKAWRRDTPSSLEKAFEHDKQLWKGARFIKSEDELQQTEQVIKKHYEFIKKSWHSVVSESSNYPTLGNLDFEQFARASRFVNEEIKVSTIDRMFIASIRPAENSELEKYPAIPKNALKRFEFIEIIVRLAGEKYVVSKQVKSYAEATDLFLQNYILPNFTPEPWQEFRNDHLWKIEVCDVYEANTMQLKKIYSYYTNVNHKFMDIEDCKQLIMQDAPCGVSEQDVVFAYGMSKMTLVQEIHQYKQYQILQPIELWEFLARIAVAKFKNSSEDMQAQPLAQKIEFVFDDIFPFFGVTRSEVNVEIEEASESDDDY